MVDGKWNFLLILLMQFLHTCLTGILKKKPLSIDRWNAHRQIYNFGTSSNIRRKKHMQSIVP